MLRLQRTTVPSRSSRHTMSFIASKVVDQCPEDAPSA